MKKPPSAAASPLSFLPIAEIEVGRLIAEALMARGDQDMVLLLVRAMQSSSEVALGFAHACDKRLRGREWTPG